MNNTWASLIRGNVPFPSPIGQDLKNSIEEWESAPYQYDCFTRNVPKGQGPGYQAPPITRQPPADPRDDGLVRLRRIGEVPRATDQAPNSGSHFSWYHPQNKNAYVRADLDENGQLKFALMAVGDRTSPNSVRGGCLFRAVLEHFGDAVQSIVGDWSYGTNLESFNALTDSGLESHSAAWKTFTGEMARRSGFDRIIELDADGHPGNYAEVWVEFGRSEPATK